MACEWCVSDDGRSMAPFEGAAPTTKRELWPENFVEGENGRGMYYCAKCREGLGPALPLEVRPAIKSRSDVVLMTPKPVRIAKEIKPESASSPANALTLLLVVAYISSIFYVWHINEEIGRWMLVASPFVLLVAGAYYFADGTIPEKKATNFIENLLKIGLSVLALWLLSKLGGSDTGSGDGPIDTYFRR